MRSVGLARRLGCGVISSTILLSGASTGVLHRLSGGSVTVVSVTRRSWPCAWYTWSSS